MTPRVLVAGASGFIGRHVVAHLLEHTDWQVVALDRSGTTGQRSVHGDSRLIAVHADLTRVAPETLRQLVGPVDFAVNLAAEADAAASLQCPATSVIGTVASTLALLEWARAEAGLKRFVQVSSAEVYGTSPVAFGEDAPAAPQNPYAASKAAADALVLSYREAFAVPAIVSATANVFGEGQPAARLLPALVRQMQGGAESVTVIQGWRRFIHAEDCASGWLWLLQNAPADWDRCHVAGGRATSHAGFAQLVADAVGWDGEIVEGGAGRPGQCGDVLLSTDRLRRAGWVRPVGLEDGIRRAVEDLAAAGV